MNAAPQTWSWRRVNVSPEDILSAAPTLDMGSSRHEINLTSAWTSGAVYLQWAHECLKQKGSFGSDAALCYAKRAACREIDGFIVCNHLNCFMSDSYPSKIQMLREIGLHIPDIVHQLIIDPRNDAEHRYSACTFERAKAAVELAELFFGATAEERARNAIISIGWCVGVREQKCSVPGKEYELIEFKLSNQSRPMLLIDVCVSDPHVMILHPSDTELCTCALSEFTRNQVVGLARLLRRFYSLPSWSCTQHDCNWLNKLKVQLGLSDALR
jgi:hypothetical protein